MSIESGIENVDVLVADVSDQNSLETMCAKATVVINCVGPVRCQFISATVQCACCIRIL